jgi:hypothetical protein
LPGNVPGFTITQAIYQGMQVVEPGYSYPGLFIFCCADRRRSKALILHLLTTIQPSNNNAMPQKKKGPPRRSGKRPGNKAGTAHQHVIADITGLQTILTCLQQQIDVLAPFPADLIVSAGTDQTITLPERDALLTATAVQGIADAWQWEQTAGPATNGAGAGIISPLSPNTLVTNLVKGMYTFRITGTPPRGDMATDTVNVAVKAP